MATSIATERRVDFGAWLRYGILGGIIAGITFAVFEMVMALVLDGADAFFMPLRMIGGIGLGPQAMDPGTSLLTAGGAGLVIHMALSMVYGVVIVAALSLVPRLSASRAAVLLSTSAAGFLLWIVNFYAVAPLFGWTWFPNNTNPVVQIVAHTVFFGTVLGLVLDRTYFRRPT
ncbi:MAG TPA: hypothetical protein VGQ89_00845 [Candidatus Limnocylindrales bacterium]|jgi:hypothetical protein|nr:hypothetical protein [Candidatus Limnocylindrales bacterium]